MWTRRLAIVAAMAFGVGFGFGLSSCTMPPVDGQTTGFPPLTVGATYEFMFSPGTGFPNGTASEAVLTEIGPYPWVEVQTQGYVIQVNLENVAYIAIQTVQ